MKTIILGDIHGRNQWQSIIEIEKPDRIIFLGDYVSTHEQITSDQQIKNLDDILCYKEAHIDDVILLRGNHDYQHLGYNWACCSGYDKNVNKWMYENKDRFLKLTQNVFIEDNIIYSHAGVSSEWLENVAKIKYPELINDLEVDEKFGFWPCKLSDYYGISPTQPPTWIRPQTLQEYAIKGYTQIVGHTRPDDIICIKSDNGDDIWLCDKMPDQYLMHKNNEFYIRNFV